MSLFCGNISKHVKSFELEEEFGRYGKCDIKRHVSRQIRADTKRSGTPHQLYSSESYR